MKTQGRPQEIIQQIVDRNERTNGTDTIDWIFLKWLWEDFTELKALLSEKKTLRLFFCTNHDTHYVGGASVILAESIEDAQRLLDAALIRHGLRPAADKPYLLTELPLTKPHALVLCDGEI